MFAFAIWDGRTHKLVLARDRMGIKPLYVAHSGDNLIFASEMKTLLASGLVERRLDPAGLRVYLQLGHVPPPWTIVHGNYSAASPATSPLGKMANGTIAPTGRLEAQRFRRAPIGDALAEQLGDDVAGRHPGTFGLRRPRPACS